MNENLLIETTIREYLELLKSGSDQNKLKEISDLLSSKVQNFTGGFDLALFQLVKDQIIIKGKWLKNYLLFSQNKLPEYQENMIRYFERDKELQEEIDRKTKQKDKEETDPYKSFLEWLLVLKKYYGSDIDQSNDLLYLVSATEQMMKSFENQKQQIEQQKGNK